MHVHTFASDCAAFAHCLPCFVVSQAMVSVVTCCMCVLGYGLLLLVMCTLNAYRQTWMEADVFAAVHLLQGP